jgi:Zn-dependent peptidase ImmA (M78 family)
MARSTYPRSADSHERKAASILRRHVDVTGQALSLPVPIEMIIEQTYELTVIYDKIHEPGDAMILGALDPNQRTIIMNEVHLELFDEVIGPDRFTLAHELSHWVYDADDPNQLTLEFGADGQNRVFCHDRNAAVLPDSDRIREVNANKLAAALLLPVSLVLSESESIATVDHRTLAATWGVSQQTLSIRLNELGLS